jgi:hypothetical protein
MEGEEYTGALIKLAVACRLAREASASLTETGNEALSERIREFCDETETDLERLEVIRLSSRTS